MAIELVIFDLGRVLIQLCDGWQHACELAGLNRPGDLDAAGESKLMDFVLASEVGDLDLHGFATGVAPILGLSDDDVKALSSAYLLGRYPGALELLDELRGLGVQTACLSNTNENHWRLIVDPSDPNHLPLDKFTYAFASHLVRMRKPEARIYEHVEQVTGVEPERIVFFDDLAENIAAARVRRWNAHQIAIGPDPIMQVREYLRASTDIFDKS